MYVPALLWASSRDALAVAEIIACVVHASVHASLGVQRAHDVTWQRQARDFTLKSSCQLLITEKVIFKAIFKF